jgi:hypothetical protein
MCQFITLHHNVNGYVVRCADCSHIQVGFGTTAISYSAEEFEELRHNLRQCHDFYQDSPFPEMKCVHFQQMGLQVKLVYSPKEITQLLDLVEMANLMLEIEKTLNTEKN